MVRSASKFLDQIRATKKEAESSSMVSIGEQQILKKERRKTELNSFLPLKYNVLFSSLFFFPTSNLVGLYEKFVVQKTPNQ